MCYITLALIYRNLVYADVKVFPHNDWWIYSKADIFLSSQPHNQSHCISLLENKGNIIVGGGVPIQLKQMGKQKAYLL